MVCLPSRPATVRKPYGGEWRSNRWMFKEDPNLDDFEGYPHWKMIEGYHFRKPP